MGVGDQRGPGSEARLGERIEEPSRHFQKTLLLPGEGSLLRVCRN